MLAARAFEPDFLSRLDRLILGIRRSRTARLGQRAVGRIQGSGIEIENFRDYVEGDDLRFLDWNLAGRLDELYVRTFRPEREVELSVVVDTSASMGAPPADDKLGLSLALGAALAYVGMSDNDAVRLVAIGEERGHVALTHTDFRRRRESYPEFKPFVVGQRSRGATRLSAAVERMLLLRRQAGIVVLLSDFLVNPSDYEEALSRLTAARHEVKVVHVMGERESSGDFPPGLYRLRDSESGQWRDFVMDAGAAALLKRRVEEHSRCVRDYCDRNAITYVQAFGAPNLDQIMTREFPRLGLVR